MPITLGGESWNEMARETVGTDSRLQFELVKSLAQANDTKEALRWAKHYKMPKDQWPWALVDCAEVELEGRLRFQLIYSHCHMRVV